MSLAKPVLGFSSRSEAAYQLRTRENLKHWEIAERIGVSPSSVGNLIRQGRHNHRDRAATYYTEPLKKVTRDRLAREAKRRGLTPRGLVNTILATVAEDGLFNAVLGEIGEGE
jgi:transposase